MGLDCETRLDGQQGVLGLDCETRLDRQEGISCLDCETRLDGQEDTSAGKLHGCSEVVLHAPQEVGTEEDGLENTGKDRPPLLVAVCLCHSLQKAGRKKKTTFIDVQSGSLAPQLFNCLMIVQYVLKAVEECGNGGTPTPVTSHTPSRGSIPAPSAPLWGGERGQSGVKGQVVHKDSLRDMIILSEW